MCKQCENIFLMEIIESSTSYNAVEQFRQAHKTYHLPVAVELVEEEELIGYWTFSEHLGQIESQFMKELSYQEKPLHQLYIYTSALLKEKGLFVVVCVANRMRYACSSLSYMPGRRF